MLGGEVLGKVPGLGVSALRQLRIGDTDLHLPAYRQRVADEEQIHGGLATTWLARTNETCAASSPGR